MNQLLLLLIWAFICAIILRFVYSFLSILEYDHFWETRSRRTEKGHPLTEQKVFWSFQEQKRWCKFWVKFCGCYTSKDPEPDLWLNYFIGVIELIVYPHLMWAGKWEIVGVWIGFKVFVPGIKYTSSKLSVNRFVLINAINILIALIFAWQNLYDCSIVRFLKH